jgi:hypothetical protein
MSTSKHMPAAQKDRRGQVRRKGLAERMVASLMSQVEVAGAGARYLGRLRAKAKQAMDDGIDFGKAVVSYSAKIQTLLDLDLREPEVGDLVDVDRLVSALGRARFMHERLLSDVRDELKLSNPVLVGVDQTLMEQTKRLRELIAKLEEKGVEKLTSCTTAFPLPPSKASSEIRELAARVVRKSKEAGHEKVDVDEWAKELASSAVGAHD